MTESILTQLFEYLNDQYEIIITGLLFKCNAKELHIEDTDSQKSKIIKYKKIYVEKEEETILKLVTDDKNFYALSFLNTDERNKIYDGLILNTGEIKNMFYGINCVLEKNNVCDKIIASKILEKIIKNKDKANFIFLIENSNRKIIYELLKYQKEIFDMFYELSDNDIKDTGSSLDKLSDNETEDKKLYLDKSPVYKNNNAEMPIDKLSDNETEDVKSYLDKSPVYENNSAEMPIDNKNNIVEISSDKSPSNTIINAEAFIDESPGNIIINAESFTNKLLGNKNTKSYLEGIEPEISTKYDFVNIKCSSDNAESKINTFNDDKNCIENTNVIVLNDDKNCIENTNVNVLNDEKSIYKQLENLYNLVFINVLSSEKLCFIQTILNFEKEKELAIFYKNFDVNIKYDNIDVIKLIKFCKNNNLSVSIEMFNQMVSMKSKLTFSKVLFYLAKYYNDVAKLYYETYDIRIIFTILRDEHIKDFLDDESEEIILYLIYSLQYIFDKSSTFSLLSRFYRYCNLLFTSNGEYVFIDKKVEQNYFIFKHYKFYDLLYFMSKNHSYMFKEFFVNSGIKKYFESIENTFIEKQIFLFKYNQE